MKELIQEIIIGVLLAIAFLATFTGAVLQESYKLTPITAEEIAERE